MTQTSESELHMQSYPNAMDVWKIQFLDQPEKDQRIKSLQLSAFLSEKSLLELRFPYCWNLILYPSFISLHIFDAAGI